MGVIKLFVTPLLLFSLLFGWLGSAFGTSVVPFGDAKVNETIEYAFTREKQRPEQLLIRQLNEAKTTADIAAYSITHKDIVSAIVQAKKRGVAVRVITDKQQAGGKSQKAALTQLKQAGIPIRIKQDSGYMHLKVTITDNQHVTSGSFNYSKNAATENEEVLMLIPNNRELAEEWTAVYDEMWNDSHYRSW